MPRKTKDPIASLFWAWLLFTFLLLASIFFPIGQRVANAGETRLSGEAGYQGGLRFQKGDLNRSLFYVQPALDYSLQTSDSSTALELNSKFRGVIDSQPGNWTSEVSVRALSITASRDSWRVVGGFQEIPWGETFGFPVLDIVNPRDFRDPLLLDPTWVRLPVAAIQGQLFLNRLTLQGILTPQGRSPLFPKSGSPYDLTTGMPSLTLASESTADFYRLGPSSEFGGRISYLFEMGLDLGLIYYRHWNRRPVYSLTAPSSPLSPFTLTPVQTQVQTFGLTYSATSDPFVFRGDIAYHLDQPSSGNTLGQVMTGQQWQSTLGSDFTSSSGWTFGLQFQTEWNEASPANRFLNWVSARTSKSLLNGKLEPELFAYMGVGNTDLWAQPKLTWNFADSWSAALRADLVSHTGGVSEGGLWVVREQSRLFLWVTAKI